MRALFDVIDKKKKQVEALKKDGQNWTRKADEIAAERKRAEEDIQQNLQRKKVKLRDQVEKVGSFYALSGDGEEKKESDHVQAKIGDVPDSEVIKQLRYYRQPAVVFAETREQRFERLYQTQVRDGIAKNQQNVFVEAIIGRKHLSPSRSDQSDEDNIYEECDSIPKETKHHRIGMWIARTLKAWQQEVISKREDYIQEGNLAEEKRRDAMLAQTKKDMQPLVKLLKMQTLEEEVLEKIYKVVECCENQDYKAAHDAYMLLAIGNAAWPMGVTMVGIHERAGRSKIFTSEVAHILNDETTRKYIQMIKRLLSFAQKSVDADPSKVVQISTSHI
ncbi:pre-mRNA splicing factor [Babesia ovis]|uniref:Pre-mRNA-splicing factor 18 n=1 Tax=Babesia ovis TaxID=5869 RepID=A0A9W5TD73_BABOV|nr:pre-mRNA splicing factor [Babesia ovis]